MRPSSDEPLHDPEHDLLDLAPQARMLARQIRVVPTPFTIGVYGEWGVGKTTFGSLAIPAPPALRASQ